MGIYRLNKYYDSLGIFDGVKAEVIHVGLECCHCKDKGKVKVDLKKYKTAEALKKSCGCGVVYDFRVIKARDPNVAASLHVAENFMVEKELFDEDVEWEGTFDGEDFGLQFVTKGKKWSISRKRPRTDVGEDGPPTKRGGFVVGEGTSSRSGRRGSSSRVVYEAPTTRSHFYCSDSGSDNGSDGNSSDSMKIVDDYSGPNNESENEDVDTAQEKAEKESWEVVIEEDFVNLEDVAEVGAVVGGGAADGGAVGQEENPAAVEDVVEVRAVVGGGGVAIGGALGQQENPAAVEDESGVVLGLCLKVSKIS